MYTGWRNIPATLSTLYLPPKERVANLVNLQAKCLAHFLSRCLKRLQTEDAYTVACIKLWNSHFYIATALHMRTIPTRLPYLQHYFHEICYMTTALRHPTAKYHSTSEYIHLLAVKHDAPKCGYSYSVHPQSGQRSGGTNILFQSTT